MIKNKIFAIIIFGIVAFVLQTTVSADPQCLPPYFIECPEDIITGCIVDTTYVQLKAVHDIDILNPLIRYQLISGPGEIDEKTGLWSFYNSSRISRPFEVEVAASILNTPVSTSGDNNCRFRVQLDYPRPPVILADGLRYGGVFMVTAPGSKSVQLELYRPSYCDITISIDSIFPTPVGDITLDENWLLTFDADAGDADQRFLVEITARDYNHIGKCTIIFDTRPTAPTPVFTNCPDTIFTTHCNRLIKELTAIDPEFESPDGIRYYLISGPGYIGDGSNVWQYRPYDEDIGQTFEVEIAAAYADAMTSGNENCRFTLAVSDNHAPDFSWWESNPCGLELPLSIPGDTMFSIWVKDTNACDHIEFFIADIEPDLSGQIYVEPLSDDRQGVVHISIDQYNYYNTFNVTLAATDHHDTTLCDFTIKTENILSDDTIEICIDYVPAIHPGVTCEVPLFLKNTTLEMGGFDIVIGYDASILTFYGATEGDALFGENSCQWEYFTYRYSLACTGDCPGGLLRVVGLAETNNGNYHPTCYIPSELPAELFKLSLRVSDNTDLSGTFAPIKFFWMDCGDNVISSREGDYIYISRKVYDLQDSGNPDNFTDITDTEYPSGYPTYCGAQDSDCFGSENPYQPIRYVDFYNGGIAIVDSDINTGDVNLNGIAYEIADYVLFRQYFPYGNNIFTIDLDAQVKNTDINKDGNPLTVADLVYMLRIIEGNAMPNLPTDTCPDIALFFQIDSRIELAFHGNEQLGAIFMIFEGEIVPTLEIDNMDLMYNFDGQNTRLLIEDLDGDSIDEGLILSINGNNELIEVSTATYEGNPVNSIIFNLTSDTDDDQSPDLPDNFALFQNYPNPFNPTTTINFDLPTATDVDLEIINIIGQVVFRHKQYYSTGNHNIEWRGVDNAGIPVSSGVYYYRLKAKDFTDSKKMILLK